MLWTTWVGVVKEWPGKGKIQLVNTFVRHFYALSSTREISKILSLKDYRKDKNNRRNFPTLRFQCPSLIIFKNMVFVSCCCCSKLLLLLKITRTHYLADLEIRSAKTEESARPHSFSRLQSIKCFLVFDFHGLPEFLGLCSLSSPFKLYLNISNSIFSDSVAIFSDTNVFPMWIIQGNFSIFRSSHKTNEHLYICKSPLLCKVTKSGD